ncbi:MAG TPA: hypothetical protein VGI65_07955 [Steroidobacteraceae bacterium]|jgi:hypothetical protein
MTPHSNSFSMAIACILLMCSPCCFPAEAQSAQQLDEAAVNAAFRQSIDNARNGRYIEASFGLLEQLKVRSAEEIKDPDVFDQWSQIMSCMTAMPTFNPAKQPFFHVPEGQIQTLRDAQVTAAIPEITRRARHARIVMLDENHLDPRGRAFGLELARALRPLGFTILAAEALRRDADDSESLARMKQLWADGYVRQSSGYYLDDPVFADFLRQSLALGYKLVSYETARKEFSQEEREQDQTDNLIHRALNANPNAKILVYVGEHHAAERPIEVEAEKFRFLAQRLKEVTGIDPLTIDQAGLSSIPMNRPDADLYDIVASKVHGQSVVLMRHGQPISVGLLGGAVDLQVVHPRVEMVGGRPNWLYQMHRRPSSIPAGLLPKSGTRLVQAFIASEAADAIPIDQVLVIADKPVPALMLPPAVGVRYVTHDVPER